MLKKMKNDLPKLPQIMKKKEASYTTDFSKWLKIIFRITGAFELKHSDTDSLPFDAVKDHQEQALFQAKHGIFSYKIPDTGFRNPFDMFVLAGVPAFIVIVFSGNSGIFYMVDIDAWLNEKQASARKSLTEARAAEIGVKYDLGGSKPYERMVLSSPTRDYIGK